MTEQELLNALKSDAEFGRMVRDNVDLRYTAAQFPAHAEALIQRVLGSESEFRRLFTTQMQLSEAAKVFPAYAEAINSKFIALVLSSSDAEFGRMVRDNVDLRYTAAQFPAHAEALIQRVLKDPALFDALVQNDYGLNAIKPFCQNIPEIQNSNSFADARTAVKEAMLRKNVEAAQAKISALARGGFFSGSPETKTGNIPPELKDQILRDHFGKK